MALHLSRRACACIPTLLLAATATAQCPIDWLPGQPAPGPSGAVRALAVAPNGDLVAGGQFAAAGGTVARNVARYDGSQWLAYGAGISGPVDCVLPLPNGQLIAAGQFETAGNAPARNIARWNGSDWFPLGLGVDGPVRDLALLPNGSVVVVGAFQTAGGVAAARAALWNGLSWSALGTGPSVSQIRSVTVLPSGDVVVGGDSSAGIPDVERFDGTNWSPLNGVSTVQLTGVSAVQALPNGEIVVAGGVLGGAAPLGRWDGNQLLPLVPPLDLVADLGLAANGDLLVVGRDTTQPISPTLARFDGAAWTVVGNAVANPYSRVAVGGNAAVYVARAGLTAQTFGQSNIASLQFGQWVPLPIAPIADVDALAALPNGDVVVGGSFQSIAGVAASNVARFTGTGYAPLALGVDGPVTSLAAAADGALIVGGAFQNAGGAPAASVARWNGASWSTLGAGPGFVPQLLEAGEGGRVLAVSGTQAALYDGQTWTVFPVPAGVARDAIAMPNGDFLVAGVFVQSAPVVLAGVLRVGNGGVTVESAIPSINCGSLVRGADGAIYVASSSPGPSLLRYDGVTSQVVAALPTGIIQLQVMPNGDLVGLAAVSSTESAVLRFDGTAWTPAMPSLSAGVALDLVVGNRGDLFAAGSFQVAGDQASFGLAHATTSCPAALVAFGAGCVGSAGPVALSASGLPWLGGVLTQTATGLPPLALALHVVGLTGTVMPLPLGAPGCSLAVDPLLLALLLPQGGEAEAPLSIPSAPALIGQNVFTQVVGVELDANLNLVRTTSSNGLRLTVGAF